MTMMKWDVVILEFCNEEPGLKQPIKVLFFFFCESLHTIFLVILAHLLLLISL